MATPIIDRPLFSLISEGIGPESVSLYISCTEGASDLEKIRQLGITTVINCAVNLDINYVSKENSTYEKGKLLTGNAPFRSHKIGLVDDVGNAPEMMLGGYLILKSVLEQRMPERQSYPVKERGNILVHCRGGRSRSVALVALYLHLQHEQNYPTLEDAITHVRIARKLHPDEWFETPKKVLIDDAHRAIKSIKLLGINVC